MLEGAPNGGDCDAVDVRVGGGERTESSRRVLRKSLAERGRKSGRFIVPVEDEQGQDAGVAADRRYGHVSVTDTETCPERPSRGVARVLASDEERLHRRDRPAPRVRRRARVPALAIPSRRTP